MLFRSDRKSTRLNSSHLVISYAVFCLKKKTTAENYSPGLSVEVATIDKELKKLWAQNEGALTAAALSNLSVYSEAPFSFFFNNPATTKISPLSLHGALPI